MTPTPRAYLEGRCTLAALIQHRSAPKPTLADALKPLIAPCWRRRNPMSPADLTLAARTAAHQVRHLLAEMRDPRDTRFGILCAMDMEALERLCEHAEAGE